MTPIRTCSLCKSKNIKNEMFRIISDNKMATLDEKHKINSRGMYICKNEKCLINLIKNLEKSKIQLKIDVDHKSLKEVLELLLVRMGE